MGADDRQHMRLLLAARLSDKTGIGTETQDEYGRNWAKEQGHTVIATAADVKSGMVAPWDRPNLKPWVTRPDKMQQYDGILAYRNDRLSRGSWDDETRIRQWASANGKVLVIVDGPQWPPRDDGDFWAWTAQAKQANAEWIEIQERNKRARRKLLNSGALVGQVPTWAFTITGDMYEKQAVPTETGRRYVPQTFKRIADGDSLAKVATWARGQGLGSGKISASTIRKMINNPIYRGQREFRFDGEIVTFNVEPLVDAKLWTRANERLKNAPRGRRTPVSGKSALLTGALFCPRCRTYSVATRQPNPPASMYRIPAGRRPHVHDYYRCAGYYPERKSCGNMIDLKETDEGVTLWLMAAPDPWKELRLVEGENHDIELADIRIRLDDLPKRNLSDANEDAERARLRTERDRLAALPNIPDHWDEVEICGTCESAWLYRCAAADHHKVTVGEHFRSLDRDGRRAMILEHVKIYGEAVYHPGDTKTAYVDLTIDSWLFKDPVPNEFGTRGPDGEVTMWPDYEQAKAHADATPGVTLVGSVLLRGDWQKIGDKPPA